MTNETNVLIHDYISINLYLSHISHIQFIDDNTPGMLNGIILKSFPNDKKSQD